jgi:hypothetical protein
MPAKQSIPSGLIPARNGSSENGQYPSIAGGVRGLLGLPRGERGAVSAAVLAAPPRGHHYGGAPFPAGDETDENFRESSLNEGFVEEAGSGGADLQSDLPRSLPRYYASLPGAEAENAATLSPTPKMPAAEHKETKFVIPGVSTQRTHFTVSHNPGTSKVTEPEEPQETGPDKPALLQTPISLSHTSAMALRDVEFLSRLGDLVTDGARERHSVEGQHTAVAPRSPNSTEQIGVSNAERDGQELVRRLEHLQRTVRDLAATVSSQAGRHSDASQTQRHERTIAAPERVVVVKRADASSTTSRAFWERSRLGRFYLRSGR